MEKHKLRSPFFVVNPKSYLYGEELRKLATKADQLCEKYDFDYSVRSTYGKLEARSRYGSYLA